MRRVLIRAAFAGLLGGCATTESPPPPVVLAVLSESRTPVYDNLSGADRIDVDRALESCRDVAVDCSAEIGRLETGAPVAMALAERACSEGRSDLCARLALLHLRGVGPGTSRAEGMRLLNVACQSRDATACVNLAIALRDDGDPAHRADVQALLRFACDHGKSPACALREEPSPMEPGDDVVPPQRSPEVVAAPEDGPAQRPERHDPPPQPAARRLDDLVAPGRILVLGAVFGTREAPDLTSRLVHRTLVRGVPVVMALDVESTEGARLERYLRGPGDADALGEVLKGFWQRPYQDGRSSQAVLRMIARARSDVAGGLPLEIVAIDEPLEAQAHTQALVIRLERVARDRPNAAIITLLGNLQAARVTRSLRKDGHRVTAVLLAHDGGSTWACEEPPLRKDSFEDPIERLRGIDCRETSLTYVGVQPVGGLPSDDPVWRVVYQARVVGLFRLYPLDAKRPGIDYVLPIGPVSASAPALKLP